MSTRATAKRKTTKPVEVAAPCNAAAPAVANAPVNTYLGCQLPAGHTGGHRVVLTW